MISRAIVPSASLRRLPTARVSGTRHRPRDRADREHRRSNSSATAPACFLHRC